MDSHDSEADLTRLEFSGLVDQAMCGATVADDRLTDEELGALHALAGALPSKRQELIGAAWKIFLEHDPDVQRRRRRREETAHREEPAAEG